MYKVWWLREASQIRQTFIPLCEKVVQSTAWQKSNRSGNCGCNWTSFQSQKKRKLKMPMRAETRETGDVFLLNATRCNKSYKVGCILLSSAENKIIIYRLMKFLRRVIHLFKIIIVLALFCIEQATHFSVVALSCIQQVSRVPVKLLVGRQCLLQRIQNDIHNGLFQVFGPI